MTQKPMTALAMVPQTQATIEPQNMGELKALASDAAASKFYGAASQEQALMILITGRDLGLSYSQALRAFHVVQGRPVLSAQGMVAVCLKHREVCEYFRTVEVSNEKATVEAKRAGDPPRTCTFTIEDARRANLANKDNWKAYPSRMLLARAQAFLAREVFSDILLGLYDADELEPTAPPAQAPSIRVVPQTPHDADGVVLEPGAPKLSPLAAAFTARIDDCHDQATYDAIAAELRQLAKTQKIGKEEFNGLAAAMNTLAESRGFQKTASRKPAPPPEPVEAVVESPAPPAVEEVAT